MFRLFITNLVLQFCLLLSFYLVHEGVFEDILLPLFWLAIACIASSTSYALLKKRFWRWERWGWNIFPSVFIFGLLVGCALYANVVLSVRGEQNLTIGIYTFFCLIALSVFARISQGLLSFLIFPWMCAHGIILGFMTGSDSGFFKAVICYAICLAVLLTVLLIRWILFSARHSDTGADLTRHHTSHDNDGIPPGGYGSSHV